MLIAAPRVLGLLLIAACIATAAFAQDETTPETPVTEAPAQSAEFHPQLERRPGEHRPRLMPERALRSQRAGATILCCRPRADRSLDCEVGWQSPERYGFGDAALRVMSWSQLTEESYADYLARGEGRAFGHPLDFNFTGADPAPQRPPRSEYRALCDAAMPPE